MKPEPSNSSYDQWLAQRREDFTQVDLSYVIMASVRPLAPAMNHRGAWSCPYLDFPSRVLGLTRIALILSLVLIPA